DGFLKSFDSLPFGPDPAKGVFNKNVYLHPTLKIHWTLPAGWNYANEATVAGAANKESQILVTIAGKEQQIDTLINNFVNGYYARTRKQPMSDGKLKLRDRTASEIILPAQQTNKILYTVWFRKDKMTYAILATGDQSQTEIFRQCTLTFRDLDESDFKDIFSKELTILNASADETPAQLTARTGNAVTAKFTAIMNGITEEGKFQKDQTLKAVRNKPYAPPVK
ncbi:MAG TPA: hypothetical protein PLR06_09215, partial [Cyclobacteriaceae bacterium]|nr:hypothetical protein [Cyclobacteriaceae bacterium]